MKVRRVVELHKTCATLLIVHDIVVNHQYCTNILLSLVIIFVFQSLSCYVSNPCLKSAEKLQYESFVKSCKKFETGLDKLPTLPKPLYGLTEIEDNYERTFCRDLLDSAISQVCISNQTLVFNDLYKGLIETLAAYVHDTASRQ